MATDPRWSELVKKTWVRVRFDTGVNCIGGSTLSLPIGGSAIAWPCLHHKARSCCSPYCSTARATDRGKRTDRRQPKVRTQRATTTNGVGRVRLSSTVGRVATASKPRRDRKAYICPAQRVHICRLGVGKGLLHLKQKK
jgi:hypothetical protein